ncbi:uracil-DNA glycosylase family protein [Asticcacaulis taihuensis]|uniref:Uracil-DNA glycosylase n=1 Tax=Asticcacaulis taihuensis TaxID=260084 RepID=A0A1G4QDP3_9CAUL|nr:uracil-DNA glycosylase family protein [Asticcacaulis taihuensis]SCW42239.1 Uracil-DNA glycosylase [Asticcacaulis taihuensis]
MTPLLNDIAACTVCATHLLLGPRPVVQAGDPRAKIRIIGQAPGLKVHMSGIPFNDASGDRLRDWLGVTPAQFYDESLFAIMPMGFCYPGRGKGGDNPPRPECAPLWHERVRATLPDIKLTLLIGAYAQAHYLGSRRKATLGDTVRAWRDYIDDGYLPLVHPSPRNQIWLKRNPWFETEIVPYLRSTIMTALT